MRFAVLGPLRVASRAEVVLDRRSHRRLLSILLLEPGRPLETDVLIDRFWGEEPPETARAALQTYVSQLRQRLGDGVIVTSGAGYLLDLRGHHLDSQLFSALASAARTAVQSGAWQEVVNGADRALGLWRGEPFPELADAEYAIAEIARLSELHIELVEMRAEALLAIGRTEDVLPDLERYVIEYPLRERLREHLMVARARLGRVSEALETYRELRRALDEIGLEPGPSLRELEERILREDPVLVPSRVHNNLPARLTTFVGRTAELDQLGDLLQRARIVTLTGVGGSGKTRLAIELAQRVLNDFPDGVYLVRYGPLNDPRLVATDAAEALGLRVERKTAAEVLTDSLRHRRVLMLLDNCEHLIEACAQLTDVLVQAGPGVSVLATSREPLRVDGEAVYAVPPLATPPEEVSSRADLREFDASRLFIDRAALVSQEFGVTAERTTAIAEICRRLDGIPLAIELAAAQVGSLSLEAIQERLDDRFQLLTEGKRTSAPRQQTLRAAIDWSYQLLADDQATLFDRLSVFAGGCTLEAAESVCSADGLDNGRIPELIARLVDKSLVVVEPGPSGIARYRLLETLREFGRDRLGDETASVRTRHCDWFMALAEGAVHHLDDTDQLDWLDRLHADRDNLAAALEWAMDAGDGATVATLAEAVGWYRQRQGHTQQGIVHMRIALDHLESKAQVEREAAIRARMAGTMYTNGDEHDAVSEARRAADLVIGAPPSAAKVRALTEFASMHQRIVQQEPEVAIAAAHEATDAARELGDRFAETHALRTLGTALAWAGEADEGIDRLREALTIAKELGNATAILGVYMRLYVTLLDHAHRPDDADALGREIVGWLEAGGDRLGGAASMLAWLSMGFLRSGDSALADELLDRCSRYHNEGMMVMSYLSMRAAVHWMRGLLDEAGAAIIECHGVNPRPRYFRMLFPLEAGILADEGRLDDLRNLVTRHLAADVAPAEEPTKAGSLHILVRAEVDAALDADGPMQADHLRRAETALDAMRDLIAHHPPTPLSGLQLETPGTCLLLAEAELTRASDPQPELWRALLDRPWYAYWRVYVRCRLGESLLAIDRFEDGLEQLRLARVRATEMGAEILRDEIASVAARAGISLAAEPMRTRG